MSPPPGTMVTVFNALKAKGVEYSIKRLSSVFSGASRVHSRTPWPWLTNRPNRL